MFWRVIALRKNFHVFVMVTKNVTDRDVKDEIKWQNQYNNTQAESDPTMNLTLL